MTKQPDELHFQIKNFAITQQSQYVGVMFSRLIIIIRVLYFSLLFYVKMKTNSGLSVMKKKLFRILTNKSLRSIKAAFTSDKYLDEE